MIADAIAKAKHILVVGHKGPDFDSAGSCFAMSLALEQMGKQTMTVVGDLPAKMKHAFGVAHVDTERETMASFKPDLAIFLDYGAVRMLPKDVLEDVRKLNPAMISIDHHLQEDQFGDIVWVDSQKTSASEMVFDLLEHMHQGLNEQIGFCLLVGMLSDTGEFVYQLDSSRLLSKMQKLNVSGKLFSYAFKVVRSWDSFHDFVAFGAFGSKLKFDADLGLAYGIIRTGTGIAGFRSFLANQLLMIDGVRYILIMEKNHGAKGYRASLRASAFESKANMGEVASHFIGGGHENAAAFNSRLSSVKIMETVKSLIKEQEKRNSS